jgi:hypothetical protein
MEIVNWKQVAQDRWKEERNYGGNYPCWIAKPRKKMIMKKKKKKEGENDDVNKTRIEAGAT